MEISVHRGLTMLKSAEDRFNTELLRIAFVEVTKGKSGKISDQTMTVSDYENYAKSIYDQVKAMITNRHKLKAAIVKSNAGVDANCDNLRTVSIGSATMTVAEAIERKSSIEFFEEAFLAKLKRDLTAVTKMLNDNERNVDAALERHLQALFGGEKTKASTEEVTSQSETFRNAHGMKMVDPLDIRKKIEDLEKEINDFKTEVDAVLSESNATTMIAVDM